jgi:hypothetical protein
MDEPDPGLVDEKTTIPASPMPRFIESLLHEPSDVPPRLTASASGLFLERVFYPGEPRIPLSGPAFPEPRV